MLVDSVKQKGFTLIELMVVMTIVGILLSLVGPMAMNALDKAEAKKELLAFQNWVQHIGAKTYYTGQQRKVVLEGKLVSLYIDSGEPKLESSYETKALFFRPQMFTVNRSGYASVSKISGTLKDKEIDIDLDKLINHSYSGDYLESL